MLLITSIEPVLGFECHVGRAFELICNSLTTKNKKESTAEEAPSSVSSWRNSMRVDEREENAEIFSRCK